jgi:hypothetical protein
LTHLERFEIVELAYDSGLGSGWRAIGGGAAALSDGGPAKIGFNDREGWILAKKGLSGEYGGVAFRVKGAKLDPPWLELRLDSTKSSTFPRVTVSPDRSEDIEGGWAEVFVSMSELNPEHLPFDRIVFRASRPIPSDWVLLDGIALTRAATTPIGISAAPRAKPVSLLVDCRTLATKISPFIFGVAGGGDQPPRPWQVGAAAERWGGNATTRYNWELNTTNSGQDWFFENHASSPYTQFLSDDAAHGLASALTIPIVGWVAKDTTSYAFPVSVFGSQAKTDPWRPDAGNGLASSGRKLDAGSPTRTSVAASAEWIGRWIAQIASGDASSSGSPVYEYILDNEPMLWSTTHRDIHPDPLGYDELLARTIQYGTAIRHAQPNALIAGPAEWGWPNYFFSAKDLAAAFGRRPDRAAHGDVPLVEWYLRSLREHEHDTGIRVLDVLDLHYYPQAENVFGGAGGTDPRTAALRLRSTRSLWDPSYVDESWIHDTIRLLPRMKEWVERNYPGLGISIGEWNFGGEGHVSGALATAEVLGRFAQLGVTSAFYWTVPPIGSPSMQGFLAYRNFDGRGGRFLDWYVPSIAPDGVSLFVSRDEDGRHLVAIAINMSSEDRLSARLELPGCNPLTQSFAYSYSQDSRSLSPAVVTKEGPTKAAFFLEPWSLTVLDLRLATSAP